MEVLNELETRVRGGSGQERENGLEVREVPEGIRFGDPKRAIGRLLAQLGKEVPLQAEAYQGEVAFACEREPLQHRHYSCTSSLFKSQLGLREWLTSSSYSFLPFFLLSFLPSFSSEFQGDRKEFQTFFLNFSATLEDNIK